MKMLPMENSRKEKLAMLFEPGHQQHGWIFSDNHGTWVTLRQGLPHEIARGESLIELQSVMQNIPTKG